MTLSIYDKAAEARLLENAQMASIVAELNRLFTDGFITGQKPTTFKYDLP